MKAKIHKCEWLIEGIIARVSREEVDVPKKNRLEFLQKEVSGLIDIYEHNGRDLVVNDEGLLLGLPLNQWASEQGLNLAGTIIEIHGKLGYTKTSMYKLYCDGKGLKTCAFF